jgi:hypothetical protein
METEIVEFVRPGRRPLVVPPVVEVEAVALERVLRVVL